MAWSTRTRGAREFPGSAAAVSRLAGWINVVALTRFHRSSVRLREIEQRALVNVGALGKAEHSRTQRFPLPQDKENQRGDTKKNRTRGRQRWPALKIET